MPESGQIVGTPRALAEIPDNISGQGVIVDQGSPFTNGSPTVENIQMFIVQGERYNRAVELPDEPMLVDPSAVKSGGLSEDDAVGPGGKAGEGSQLALEALRQHYNMRPLSFTVKGMLQAGNSIKEARGSTEYPGIKIKQIEQLIKESHLIAYASDTNMRSGIGFIRDLAITDFTWEDLEGVGNAAGFELTFQKVVAAKGLTTGEKIVEAIQGGLKSLLSLEGIGAAAGIGAGIGYLVGGPVGAGIGAAIGAGGAIVVGGLANIIFGSIPWQQWQSPIPVIQPNGTVLEDIYDFAIFETNNNIMLSVGKDGEWIAEEIPLKLNVDILERFQDDPRLRGIHMIPASVSGSANAVTSSNFQDDVHIFIAQTPDWDTSRIESEFLDTANETYGFGVVNAQN